MRRKSNGKAPARTRRAREAARLDFGRLPGYIGYRVRLAQSAIFRHLARPANDPGVTPGEFSLMTVVGRNSGINSATLARTYGLDKATLSLTLKRLTQAGLVRTARREDDRRHLALKLTPAGRAALRRAARRIERQERVMDSVLAPGERERLLDLLGRIAISLI
jgi:DNA-binding MarR family transcriptional regulator